MTFEQLYPYFPLPLQKLAVHLEGWRLQHTRFGRDFEAILKSVRARADWSLEELHAFRDQRLHQFVRHAVEHVPYYTDLFARLGLRPDDIRTLADLRQLPVLTKAEVAADPSRFLAKNLMRHKRIAAATSGTTGTAMAFQILLTAYQEQRAVWWRFRDRFGLDSREPCMYFTGRTMVVSNNPRPPFWRYNSPGRQLLLSGQHMHPENADLFFDEMERCGYRWLHGYTSMLAVMAHFALQHNRRFQMKWVSLGGENVMPQQAEVIEAAFGVKPIAHYGMVEQVANFSQCSHGMYHVDEDFAAVDFEPIGTDGDHLVLGTNLVNPLFPLIRYSAGDVVTLGQSACPCGLPGRTIESIDGRKEDYIIGKNGIILTRFDYLFKQLPHVREAQIRQSRPGHMTICVVKGPNYNDDDERHLRQATLVRTGGHVDFEIEYVDRLPRTANGKLRFVVSTLRSGGATSAIQGSVPTTRQVA